MRTLQGQPDAAGRYAIVASRFNEAIVDRLLKGALDALGSHGVAEEDISVVRVPGAFELPQIVRRVAAAGDHDGIIALGCLIRGQTPHFDFIAEQCAAGLAEVALAGRVSVTFGVLTTDNLEQAVARSAGKADNKGYEAALAAMELVDLTRRLEM